MSSNVEDLMSPESSPGRQSKKSGVRRVNNLPMYIVGGGLGVFLIVMVLVASDRASRQQQRASSEEVKSGGGSTSLFAKEIAGDRTGGIVEATAANPPVLPSLSVPPDAIPIVRPLDLDAPPVPPGAQGLPGSQQAVQATSVRSASDDEAERFRQLKLQQLDEAVKARTSIGVAAPRSAGSGPSGGISNNSGPVPSGRDDALARLVALRQQLETGSRDDSTAAYKAKLQQIMALAPNGVIGGGDVSGAAPKALPLSGGQSDPSQFAGGLHADRWRLESQPEAPRSPYELRVGYIVPATLISGINSELPGQIVAQVSQDVYDTPLGKYKLIPQGARLVGSYASEVAYGQSRVLVAWHRIIFPDGKAMDIGAMPGADVSGYAGFTDQVNNHFARVFSSAFLMSGITAGIALSQPAAGNNNARPTASSALSEALGQQLGQTTAQLIAKSLNVAPTLEIRPGYRFSVVVTKDMTFSKPYKAFDY